ncbi:MAG: hypothetical protein ACRD52_13115, partial [Candidatus Acidiferrales bacterium]
MQHRGSGNWLAVKTATEAWRKTCMYAIEVGVSQGCRNDLVNTVCGAAARPRILGGSLRSVAQERSSALAHHGKRKRRTIESDGPAHF